MDSNSKNRGSAHPPPPAVTDSSNSVLWSSVYEEVAREQETPTESRLFQHPMEMLESQMVERLAVMVVGKWALQPACVVVGAVAKGLRVCFLILEPVLPRPPLEIDDH